jgi:long-chain acyl-CoA synthetase
MNLSCTLHSSARQFPHYRAISWDGGGLSYADFERQAAGMAGALRGRHGLAPGSRVALAMENCPEFLPALYAVWRAGLSAVPINSKLHAREMAWIMADSQARLCLATRKIADALSAPGVGAVPPVLVAGHEGLRDASRW